MKTKLRDWEVRELGYIRCPLRLAGLDGGRTLDLEALVDTGSAYSFVPARLLKQIGVSPIGRVALEMADGRPVRYDIGQAWATVDDESVVTLVVFGNDEATVLLGAYTLEGLRLAPDPVAQRLVPAPVQPL